MRIFISYDRRDRVLCDAVLRELELLEGVEVTRDTSGRDPGS